MSRSLTFIVKIRGSSTRSLSVVEQGGLGPIDRVIEPGRLAPEMGRGNPLRCSAVMLRVAAFDEVVGVFHSAQGNSTLSNTAWYGSDGVALSAALTGDSSAAAFADTVGYPNPIFGLPDALRSEWQPIADAIQARTGIEPDAFALSAYDALFVVKLALRDVKQLKKNFDNFKGAFVDEANTYNGVTGSTALDAAGDRLNGDFDFWAVRPQGGSYGWVRTGTYNNGVLTLF